MHYTDWLQEQTLERKELSHQLLDISYHLGEANKKNDKQAIRQHEQELKEIYSKIKKADESA